MEKYILQAKTRDSGRTNLKKARRGGYIPAIIYGGGMENLELMVSVSDIRKLSSHLGESTLIDLVIEGKDTVKVLIPEIQKDPLSGEFVHIDFRHIRMDQELEAEIALTFIGESSAVKGLGGIFVKGIESISVKCLPTALVDEIIVDISSLNDFEKTIRVKDLNIPSGMSVLNDPEAMIASVSASAEEEVATGAPVEDVSTIEASAEKKVEGEEGKDADAKEKK